MAWASFHARSTTLMTRAFLFTVLTLLIAAPSQAQFTLSGPDTSRVLTVTGFGKASADIDKAVLRIAFETEGETIDEALDKHETEVARVQEILTGAGIPEGEIKLERVSVGPAGGGTRFESIRPGDSVETFTASRVLVVGVTDLDIVPRLMAELVRNDDDDLLDIQRRNVDVRYTVAETQALEDEALQTAVARARERALLITEMAGLELGEVIAVIEGGGGSLFGMEALAMAMAREGGNGGLTDGEYVSTSSVVVSFRIR